MRADQVNAGDVIARLDTRSRSPAAQAQANVDAQNRDPRKPAGPAPRRRYRGIATALASAEQTLEYSYGNVPNSISSAYASANDAVRNELAAFFTNAETGNPQLVFPVNITDRERHIIRTAGGVTELNTWGRSEDHNIAIGRRRPRSTLRLQNTLGHLAAAKTLLTTASDAIVNADNWARRRRPTRQTNVTTGTERGECLDRKRKHSCANYCFREILGFTSRSAAQSDARRHDTGCY